MSHPATCPHCGAILTDHSHALPPPSPRGRGFGIASLTTFGVSVLFALALFAAMTFQPPGDGHAGGWGLVAAILYLYFAIACIAAVGCALGLLLAFIGLLRALSAPNGRFALPIAGLIVNSLPLAAGLLYWLFA